MRTPVLFGNWKMNLLPGEAASRAKEIAAATEGLNHLEIGVCPSFPALIPVRDALADSAVILGAQNVSEQEKGAFTGEVSAAMLREIGCRQVIIGHSERRRLFMESIPVVRNKMCLALESGLHPILCLGESLEEREDGRTFSVLETQLTGAFDRMQGAWWANLILAYEPIWAIGTGMTATPEQAQDVHAFLRSWIGRHFGSAISDQLRIQYGGSLNAENITDMLSQPDIDGGLVGNASLQVDSFVAMLAKVNELYSNL